MVGILGEEASHSITNTQATELKVHKLHECLNGLLLFTIHQRHSFFFLDPESSVFCICLSTQCHRISPSQSSLIPAW